MADPSDQPLVPQPSNPPVATAGTSTNQTSTVKAMTKWFKNKTTSKTNQGLASLKSQSKQFIAPDGTKIDMEILPTDIAVFTTKTETGQFIFNQEVGTKKAAKGHYFIAFTNLPDLNPPTNRWILGQISEP